MSLTYEYAPGTAAGGVPSPTYGYSQLKNGEAVFEGIRGELVLSVLSQAPIAGYSWIDDTTGKTLLMESVPQGSERDFKITVPVTSPWGQSFYSLYLTPSDQARYLRTHVPLRVKYAWSLDQAIERLPEVYTAKVSPDAVDEYRSLVQGLAEPAQRWVAGMGWGLEDLALDAGERKLLAYLARASHDPIYSLRVLSSPEVISHDQKRLDAIVAQEFPATPLTISSLLEKDVAQLKGMGLFSSQAEQGLENLEAIVAADGGAAYDLVKGLVLISNFGHPNKQMIPYAPDYNTQLLVLGELFDLGVPDGWEVAAVAAALDYGSLWTIADDQVRELIAAYAKGMIEFQVETEPIVAQKGAAWRPSTYTLEENITLMWGLPGSLYADEQFQGGMQHEFKDRKFTTDDWSYSVFRQDYMREVRDFLLTERKTVDATTGVNLDRLANRITDLWYRQLLDYVASAVDMSTGQVTSRIDVHGRNVAPSYISCMNYQWERLQDGEKFIGGSGDAYIKFHFDQAIGLVPFMAHDAIHVSGYGNPFTEAWYGSSAELQEQLKYGQTDPNPGWTTVRWDNWHVSQSNISDKGARARFLEPVLFSIMCELGVPNSYIFRKDMGGGDFYLPHEGKPGKK